SSRKTFSSVSPACDMQTVSHKGTKKDTKAQMLLCASVSFVVPLCELLLGRRFSSSFDQRPHFDRARARGRDARGDGSRFVEVLCFDQEVPAELFVRLRERTVGDEFLAVAHAHTRRGRDRL